MLILSIILGNNGIFFIVFNATIRAAVMASFRREATKIIPLKNLTKTQHEIHPSTSGNSKL